MKIKEKNLYLASCVVSSRLQEMLARPSTRAARAGETEGGASSTAHWTSWKRNIIIIIITSLCIITINISSSYLEVELGEDGGRQVAEDREFHDGEEVGEGIDPIETVGHYYYHLMMIIIIINIMITCWPAREHRRPPRRT